MQPRTTFRTGTLPSLHDQAWNGWRNSQPNHFKDADATPEHIDTAKALIEEDSTCIMADDAADIASRWDTLFMEVCGYNGYGVFDPVMAVFNPFEARFTLVRILDFPE